MTLTKPRAIRFVYCRNKLACKNFRKEKVKKVDLHGDERNFLPHICYREEATGWHAHIIGLLPQLKSKQAKVLSSYNPCNQNHIFFFFCANIPQLNLESPSSLPTIT